MFVRKAIGYIIHIPKLFDTTDSTITDAFNSGIIAGSGNGKFDPKGQLTRQEAAVILYREWNILSSEGYDTVIYPRIFSDSGKIAVWAADAIRYMNQIGVLNGASDGEINPTGYTTREQAMILVLRNYEALAELPDAVSSATVNPDDDEEDDDD